MKSYTVVNEVEVLQRAYALWMYGAEFVCELLCKGVCVWGVLSGGCCDNAAIKKSSLSRENEQHQEVSGREVVRKVKLETETELSGEARKNINEQNTRIDSRKRKNLCKRVERTLSSVGALQSTIKQLT